MLAEGAGEDWGGGRPELRRLTCPKLAARPCTCVPSSPDLGFWARLCDPSDPFWLYHAEISLKGGRRCFHPVAKYTPQSWRQSLSPRWMHERMRERAPEIQAILPGIPWEALVLHWNCGTSHSISKLGFREEMGSYLDSSLCILGLTLIPTYVPFSHSCIFLLHRGPNHAPLSRGSPAGIFKMLISYEA